MSVSSTSKKGTEDPGHDPAGEETASGQKQLLTSVRERLKGLSGPLVGLLVMVVALSFLSPFFLTPRNLTNIASQISDIGIMAAGAALVILIGGIDLSVAATMALTMMVTAWLYDAQSVPWPRTNH